MNELDITQVHEALTKVQQEIVWRPGKADQHLLRRIGLGHLPTDATVDSYEAIIREVVMHPDAHVYAYCWSSANVYTVAVALVHDAEWLVMVGLDGVMETAFVVDKEGYLDQESFVFLGTLAELEESHD